MTATQKTKAPPTVVEVVAYGLAAPTRSKPGDERDEHGLTQLRESLSHYADRPDKVRLARGNHHAAQLEAFRVALPGSVPDTDEALALAARDFLCVSERCVWREG